MPLIKRFRGKLILNTKRVGGWVLVRVALEDFQGQRLWLSLSEDEYRRYDVRVRSAPTTATDDRPLDS